MQRGASSRIPECLPSTILSVCSYRFMVIVFSIYSVSSRCHALTSGSSSSPYRARDQRVLSPYHEGNLLPAFYLQRISISRAYKSWVVEVLKREKMVTFVYMVVMIVTCCLWRFASNSRLLPIRCGSLESLNQSSKC